MPSAPTVPPHRIGQLDQRTLADRDCRVAVCLPARDEVETVGSMVETLVALRSAGCIDQVAVIDAGSQDGTATAAAKAGADVYQRDDLLTAFGPARGKGDAIWRAQSVLDAEVLCFFDADLKSFHPGYVVGLVAPLLRDPSLHLVKATFARPLRLGGVVIEAGGGRVTELLAKPLIEVFYPELARLGQPLSGKFAVRAPLLASLPLPTGYGVDIGLLIGAWRAKGLQGLAEADLGVLETNHQSLQELGTVASAVLETLLTELVREERLDRREARSHLQVERPPFDSLASSARH